MKTSRPFAALGIAGLILLALVGCASKTDQTSLIVRVESDLVVGTEIDTIVVDGHAVAVTSASDLPVVVAFTPSAASNAAIAVTATARWNGTDVVQQSITTAFQPSAAVLIVMHLDRACISKTCNADQTCQEGNCGPKPRTPTPYPGAKDAGSPRADAQQSTDAADVGKGDAGDGATEGNPRAVDGSSDAADGAAGDTENAGAPDGRDSSSPDVQTMTCGDGQVHGTELCDDFNTSSCGTCSAGCTAVQPASPAIGSITAIGANNLLDGETFTVTDGLHPPTVFEFNNNAPTDATHIQIVQGANLSTGLATKIAVAINSIGAALQINAVVSATNRSQVLLTDINPGVTGNVGITETVANGSFMVTGMSGGTGRDCPLGFGCGSNNDCQSGSCCIGAPNSATCLCPSGTCAANTCVP